MTLLPPSGDGPQSRPFGSGSWGDPQADSGVQLLGGDPSLFDTGSLTAITVDPGDPDLPARPSQSGRRKRRRTPPRARTRRSVPPLELLLLVVAVVAAAWPWTAVFDGDPTAGEGIIVPLVIAAAVAPLAVAACRRLPWVAAALIACVVTTVVTTVLLFAEQSMAYVPDGDAWHGLYDGTAHGWAYLLTITLPADPRGVVAVTPVLVTGLAAMVGALLVTRTRVALLPLIAPLICLAPALAFSAAAHPGNRAATAVLLLAMLMLAVRRTSRLASTSDIAPGPAPTDAADDGLGTLLPVASAPATATRFGRAAFSSPVVALVAAAAVGLAPLLGISDGATRYDPRSLRHDEVRVDEQITPLATLKTQLARDPALSLFTVRVEQPSDARYRIDRIRTAVLTGFDGATWSAGGTYRRADSVLPTGDELVSGPRVREKVLLSGLTGPYLPSIGRPHRIENAGAVGFDPATGVLVTADTSLQGLEFTVEATPSAHGAKLTTIRPAEGPAQALLLPNKPDWVTEALEATGASDSDDLLTQLKAVETYLRAKPYALDVPSGHSYFRIRRMLLGEPGEDTGFAEQRASAFAVLARALGVPARVVVGYELRSPASDGTYAVTTENLTAWPEVNLQEYGWVSFDPTGSKRTPPPMKQQKDAPPEGTDNSQRQAPDLDVPPVLFDEPDPGAPDPGPMTAWERVRRIGTMGSGALLAFIVTVLGLKLLRRTRRRTSGGPAQRILGAWQEVVDRLTETGRRPAPAQTPHEVLRGLSDTLDEESLTALHPLTGQVSRALYAPAPPAAEDAASAWALSRQACRALRRTQKPHRRLLAGVDPRPLLPRRGVRGGAARQHEPRPGKRPGRGEPKRRLR